MIANIGIIHKEKEQEKEARKKQKKLKAYFRQFSAKFISN